MAESKKFKACLFDMDGLLINSEDIYTIVSNQILEEYGKGPLSWDVKLQLQGRPGPEASRLLIQAYDLPLEPHELFAKSTQLQTEVWSSVKFLPGALELLQHLKEAGIPMALATSSHKRNFDLKTGHLRHGFDLFGQHIVVGDDPRIPPGRGKPYPDIWLTALAGLNAERVAAGLEEIEPHECLVFEDGIPGVQAGKAAGCTVIWVPHAEALQTLDGGEQEIIGDAGEVLRSLLELDKEKYGLI